MMCLLVLVFGSILFGLAPFAALAALLIPILYPIQLYEEWRAGLSNDGEWVGALVLWLLSAAWLVVTALAFSVRC